MALLYDADNIVVGQCVAWFAPWIPGQVVTPLVDDATPLFSVWPDPWLGAGSTEEGFQIGADMDIQDHHIEEQSTLVAQTVNSSNFSAVAALAEDTLQSMALSWNLAPVVKAAASAGIPGTEKTTLTDKLTNYTFGFEMRNFYGMARRIYVPKVSVHGTDKTSFRRSDSKRTYPIAIASLCAPEEIQIVDIVEAAL